MTLNNNMNIDNAIDIESDNMDEMIDDMIIDIFRPYMLYIKMILNENDIKKKFIIENKKKDREININVLNGILKKHLDINNNNQ
jgi:hypothetical protein